MTPSHRRTAPLRIVHTTLTSAVGCGMKAQGHALQHNQSGLSNQPFEDCTLPCYTGVVQGLQPLTDAWAAWNCRNNQLAELGQQQDGFAEALQATIAQHGAARVGLFIGTSSSGVQHTERAYRERADSGHGVLPAWFNYRTSQNTFSVGQYLRLRWGLSGISMVISTACSSSAKVFASAARAIRAGVCDAAVVGGVDSLCLTTLHGFHALQLLSPEPCRPADAARRGISIGEAAGFALLLPESRFLESLAPTTPPLYLLGCGESSDAHHMSAPHPEGHGAFLAMQTALHQAQLPPEAVDFIHLHGTGTPANDTAEDRAVFRLLGRTPAASTKGVFGHTLGAAGMVGVAVGAWVIEHGLLPASAHTHTLDPTLQGQIVLQPRSQKVQRVLCNAFGFGGNNCSVLLGSQP